MVAELAKENRNFFAVPQDIQLESIIIGATLLDLKPNTRADELVKIVKPEAFYEPRHRLIWEAIYALATTNQGVSPESVRSWMADQGTLERAGGYKFLADVVFKSPDGEPLSDHAEKIHGYYIHREYIRFGEELIRLGRNTALSPQELKTKVEELYYDVVQKFHARSTFVQFSQIASSFYTELEKRTDQGKPPGFSSGFPKFDEMIGGYRPGRLYFVLAPSKTGKSVFGLQSAVAVAEEENQNVLFYSLEMTTGDLLTRHIASTAGVDGNRIIRSKMDDDEWQKVWFVTEQILDRNSLNHLYVDDTEDLTIEDIESRSIEFASKHGSVGLIVIDHFHLINYGNAKEYEALDRNGSKLRQLAKKLNCAVVALCQPADLSMRDDKRANENDFQGCKRLKNHAHVIVSIHRPDLWSATARTGETEFWIVKNRDGQMGTFRMMFEAPFTRFTPLNPWQ